MVRASHWVGLTLPGIIDDLARFPGWRFHQCRSGAGGQPADIVSDFHQRGRRAFQRAVGMDQGIHSGQRFEFVRRGDKWLSAERRQLGRHAYGIFRMGIQPGSYRRPPSASSARCG